MMYAKEAHEIAKTNNTEEKELKAIVEKVLPLFENQVRFMSENGCYATFVKKEAIRQEVDTYFFAMSKVMDAIAEELKKYGYKTSIPPSYTSIHLEW